VGAVSVGSAFHPGHKIITEQLRKHKFVQQDSQPALLELPLLKHLEGLIKPIVPWNCLSDVASTVHRSRARDLILIGRANRNEILSLRIVPR
jgi:hypothetical protein